jgi:hypothetical protein
MDFVQIGMFASRLEAETVGHALDQYGIPFIVKSENIGFCTEGALVGGASLWVPDEHVAEVRVLIRCAVSPASPVAESSGEAPPEGGRLTDP